MPVIPEDSNVGRSPFAAGGVQARADPAAFAAGATATEQIGAAITKPALEFANQYGEARRAKEGSDATFAGWQKLQDARFKWQQVPDNEAAQAGFQQDAARIKADTLAGINDPRVASYVTRTLDYHTITLGHEVRTHAFDLESSQHRADVDTQLDQYATAAAAATNPLERAGLIDQANAAVKGSVAGGWMHAELGALRIKKFNDQVYTAIIRNGLENDPDGTVAALKSGQFDDKLSLQAREMLQPRIDTAQAAGLARHVYGSVGPASSNAVNTDIPPEGRALLDSISAPESRGRYDVRYTPGGGVPFTDFSQHPNIPEPSDKGPSTAAGRYQIVKKTWDPVAQQIGATDFSPKNQDAAAWTIAQQAYKSQTGGDLLQALKDGKLDQVQKALRDSNQWTTANLSSFGANLKKYQTEPGTSAPPASSAAAAAAPPDLDQAIQLIQGQTGVSDAVKERAISDVTRLHSDWARATAGARDKLVRDTKDGIAMLAAGGDWTPDEKSIRSLLPAEKADEAMRLVDEAREQGQIRNAIQWATPQQLAELTARSQQRLANPDDFARNQRYATTLATSITAREKAIEADPAGFVSQAPEIQQAFAAIQSSIPANGTDQEKEDAARTATEGAIAASMALQSRLGVLAPNLRAIDNQTAANRVDAITAAQPGDADIGTKLDQMARSYGRFWPNAFGDMVRAGLPAPYQVLASMDRPDQAAARGDLQRALQVVAEKGGAQKLKEAAPPAAVQQIDQNIDERLSDFRQTVRWNEGGVKLFDTLRDATKELAYFYASQGTDGGAALEKAYQGVLGQKYDFNGSIRAPKGQLPVIDQATQFIQQNLKPAELAALPGNPDLTPAERQDVYVQAARNGNWIPNEDDSGLVLMARFRNGAMLPVKHVDGSRIELKFNDAARVAAGLPALNPDYGAGGVP